MIKCYNIRIRTRILLLISVLFASVEMFGDGFTPTEGGLVVDLKKHDRFLLSVWIDVNGNGTEEQGEEFFVCDNSTYTGAAGGRFKYAASHTLKLIPQDADATEPSPFSIWTVDTALVRPENERMSGRKEYPAICYTMWSKDGYTLLLNGNFMTQGAMTNNKNHTNTVDVVFVVPTGRATTSFDPNGTLGRGPKFSGVKGIGFLGMSYREVYWLDIPRNNIPKSYTNASLVGFNTTLSDYKYPTDKKQTATPGQALYAFADDKHKPTKRTLFRLYTLDEQTVSSCPESNYYFAYSQRFWGRYRIGPGTVGGKTKTLTDSTTLASFLTMDRLTCMDSIPGTTYYQTD